MWSDEEFFYTLTQTVETSKENEYTTDFDDIQLADIKQRSKYLLEENLVKMTINLN